MSTRNGDGSVAVPDMPGWWVCRCRAGATWVVEFEMSEGALIDKSEQSSAALWSNPGDRWWPVTDLVNDRLWLHGEVASQPPVKPPIGVKPRWINAEHRLEELHDGVMRFVRARKDVPRMWLAEYRELTEYLAGLRKSPE